MIYLTFYIYHKRVLLIMPQDW